MLVLWMLGVNQNLIRMINRILLIIKLQLTVLDRKMVVKMLFFRITISIQQFVIAAQNSFQRNFSPLRFHIVCALAVINHVMVLPYLYAQNASRTSMMVVGVKLAGAHGTWIEEMEILFVFL